MQITNFQSFEKTFLENLRAELDNYQPKLNNEGEGRMVTIKEVEGKSYPQIHETDLNNA